MGNVVFTTKKRKGDSFVVWFEEKIKASAERRLALIRSLMACPGVKGRPPSLKRTSLQTTPKLQMALENKC